MIALLGKWRQVGQFTVAATENHTRPLKLVRNLIDLDTHSWIRAHPFDLLTGGSEPIEMVRLICEVDRHDIRLIMVRTSESSNRDAHQNLTSVISLICTVSLF